MKRARWWLLLPFALAATVVGFLAVRRQIRDREDLKKALAGARQDLRDAVRETRRVVYEDFYDPWYRYWAPYPAWWVIVERREEIPPSSGSQPAAAPAVHTEVQTGQPEPVSPGNSPRQDLFPPSAQRSGAAQAAITAAKAMTGAAGPSTPAAVTGQRGRNGPEGP